MPSGALKERLRSQHSPVHSARPKAFENLRGNAGAFVGQAGEKVVGGDEWVVEALGFFGGDLEGFGGAGCEGEMRRGAVSGFDGDQAGDFGADGLVIQIEGFVLFGVLFKQGKEEMFRADEIVTESECFGA